MRPRKPEWKAGYGKRPFNGKPAKRRNDAYGGARRSYDDRRG